MTEQEMKAAREERARYQREWRAKHKEQVKAINARYWVKRAARIAQERANDQKGANHESEI